MDIRTSTPPPLSLASITAAERPQRCADVLLEAENISLRSLVHHRHFVEQELPLEQTQREFNVIGVDYMALLRNGHVVGLCSRLSLGILLGARFGFALHSRSPAHLAQVEHPLVFSTVTPVREVLDRSLARRGDEFHEDVVLVDENHDLLGLIPIDALARLQSRLVAEQVNELRRRHLDLFQANHALRQSQGLYLGLFHSHPLGIALLDRQGLVHEHNRRLGELLRLPLERSGTFSLAPHVSEPDRAAFAQLLEGHSHPAAASTPVECQFNVPGRGTRLFRLSPGWIRETGQICLCLEDITEQRAMERHVVSHEKQVLLDTLVGGIAHELNNKLTPVQAFSELIRENSEKQNKLYADLIAKSAAEAAVIIRQLLQLSKPVSSANTTVDLRKVIEEALAMLRFKIRETGCSLHSDLGPVPVWVRADTSQLKQVVLNLALNGIDAVARRTPGQLTVVIETDERIARIIVGDNGTGIPREILGRIFDPFFTTKGPDAGTGLGLSVCFSIVRQHGGDIAVTSTVGVGSTFRVTLPLEAAEPLLLEIDGSSAPVTGPAASPGRLALVVDDELIVRRLMQELLTVQLGCRVDVAANGAEALECVSARRYDLVVSDIRMPGMSGTELFLRLRDIQPATARRLIFVTGHSGEKALDEEIASWGVPVLMKPFTVDRFCEACRPFLSARNAPPGDST